MTEAKPKHEWTTFLKFFGEQNQGRNSRLGVFDGANDYWLESGRKFTGIDIDSRDELPSVEIYFGDFTHSVENALSLKAVFSHTGDEDGLDITDNEGRTTVLRFEK